MSDLSACLSGLTEPQSPQGLQRGPRGSQCEGSSQQGRPWKQLDDYCETPVAWGIMSKCIRLQTNRAALRGPISQLLPGTGRIVSSDSDKISHSRGWESQLCEISRPRLNTLIKDITFLCPKEIQRLFLMRCWNVNLNKIIPEWLCLFCHHGSTWRWCWL